MNEKNIPQIRQGRKRRLKKHDQFMIELYNKLTISNNDTDDSINILDSAVENRNISDFTKVFRLL